MDVKRIKYTLVHRRAIIEIEKRYRGYNTLSIYFHDLDKVILYLFLPKKIVTKIHRMFSLHHIGNIFGIVNIDEAILDWECARFTKIDKPLNAYETCKKYYPELLEIVSERMEEIGI